MPSLNGQETIKGFKTTEEQLKDFVPYVEVVSADGKATGLEWRLVNLSDVTTAVSLDYDLRVRVRAWDENGNRCHSSEVWNDAGQALAGSEKFDESVSRVLRVEVTVYLPEYLPGRHIWHFCDFNNQNVEFWANHISGAEIINGKSDYTNAKFSHLYLCTVDNTRTAEEKYFTREG